VVADLDAASPLEALFDDTGGREAALREWQVKVQEEAAICMIGQGFEFTVSIAERPEMFAQLDALGIRPWTELYGYGMSTSTEALLSVQAADPNTQYFLSLPVTQQESYMIALVGEQLGTAVVAPTEMPSLTDQGCTGRAVLAHGGSAITEDLEEVTQQYDERMRALQESDEMASAIAGWQQCMATEGFQVRSQEPLIADIGGELEGLLQPVQEAVLELTQLELAEVFENPETAAQLLPGLNGDRLAALQQRERRTALVDLDCYEAHVKETLVPLQHRVENNLISEYSDEIEAAQQIFGS